MLKMSVRTVGLHEADSRLTAKSRYYSWPLMKGMREKKNEKKKKKKRGGEGVVVEKRSLAVMKKPCRFGAAKTTNVPPRDREN